ncbi:MAG: hypothetical protein NTY39_11585 [Campylobacterales bacterium]|nr:hypothetical protein [Campylobacterales bacterium]
MPDDTTNEIIEDINSYSMVDDEIVSTLSQLQEESAKKIQIVNKRIDFDKKTLRRIETMIPVYSEDLGGNASSSEQFSYVIRKAIDSLFEGDFKHKIDEL